MGTTVLGEAIDLLQDFGFFDVVLPFLLVFTIVFGILEKTKIFGTEKFQGNDIPKKNLNAMVAFSIAFFVVAAKEIVASLQESLPLIALILVAIISFLMLVGSFASGKEEFDFYKMFAGWNKYFAGVFIVAIVAVFFHSFGWLDIIYDYISGIGSDVFIIVVFLLLTFGIMKFVFDSGKGDSSGGDDE